MSCVILSFPFPLRENIILIIQRSICVIFEISLCLTVCCFLQYYISACPCVVTVVTDDKITFGEVISFFSVNYHGLLPPSAVQ